MFNLDDIINKNNENYNKKWPYIPDHPYKMLIIGGSGSNKTNAQLNFIKQEDSNNLINKFYLYAKGLRESKYQFLVKKHEDAGIKHLHDPKAFIQYSQYMDDVYNNINYYNPS